MYYSVGILYSVYRFLKLIKKVEIMDSDFIKTFNQFNVANASSVLEASINYNWVSINSENKLHVTTKGDELLQLNSDNKRLRTQLMQMIVQDNPIWAKNTHLGRNEIIPFLKPNILQCFREANLLDTYSTEVVQWWDNISYFTRNNNDIYLSKLGRQAEELSIKYETKRTGVLPKWISIDSNLTGYDLLSIVDVSNPSLLSIEVKGIYSTLSSSFYLTDNEWEVAMNSDNYIFHLWDIKGSDCSLSILLPDDLTPLIPSNTEYSKWEKIIVTPPKSLLEMRKAN